MIDDLVALPFKVTFQVLMKQQHFDLRPSERRIFFLQMSEREKNQ